LLLLLLVTVALAAGAPVAAAVPPMGWAAVPPMGWAAVPPMGWAAVPPMGWAAVPPMGGPARVVSVRPLGGRLFQVVVYSRAMRRLVPLWVSHPPRQSAPTLYLLNGIDGGEEGGAWPDRTDLAQFVANKRVNVVVPLAGRASFYTDWERDDPAVERYEWTTFLTDELPALIDGRFGTTGRDAIAGVSMSATSVLELAAHAPGRYRAVGSFSGCPSTSGGLGRLLVQTELALFGANAANMWGPPADPRWLAEDPMLHVDQLRGTPLYIAVGTGAPGPYDGLFAPWIDGNPSLWLQRLAIGGALEAAADGCTHDLLARLRQRRIPATVVLRPAGTHAWPYWQDDLHDSWPMFAAALR
jgi:S-formylglutathione hydrolase FrmB